jgi:hypothetical protein
VFWAGGQLPKGDEATTMIGRKGEVSDTIILNICSTSLSCLSEEAKDMIMNTT